MLVKELREALKDVPDEAIVLLDTGNMPCGPGRCDALGAQYHTPPLFVIAVDPG